MNIVDTLLGEHGIINALLDYIETGISRAGSLPSIQYSTAILETLINSHSKLEEELLDPVLEPHFGKAGPLAQMKIEHTDISNALVEIKSADNAADCVERVRFALQLVRSHFQKEEAVLFDIVSQILSDELQMQLGNAWARSRGVSYSQPTTTT